MEEDFRDVKVKMEPSQPRIVDGLKSSLSIFRVKKYPKKSVRWKRDDELESIQYFEVDATERSEYPERFLLGPVGKALLMNFPVDSESPALENKVLLILYCSELFISFCN